MSKPDTEIDELSAIFHQLRTRVLRDAPIYIEHISAAEKRTERLLATHKKQLLEAVLEEPVMFSAYDDDIGGNVLTEFVPVSHIKKLMEEIE